MLALVCPWKDKAIPDFSQPNAKAGGEGARELTHFPFIRERRAVVLAVPLPLSPPAFTYQARAGTAGRRGVGGDQQAHRVSTGRGIRAQCLDRILEPLHIAMCSLGLHNRQS